MKKEFYLIFAFCIVWSICTCGQSSIENNQNTQKKQNPFIGTWLMVDGSNEIEWIFTTNELVQKFTDTITNKQFSQNFNYTFDDKILTCVLVSATDENGHTEYVKSGRSIRFSYIATTTSLTLIDTPDHSFTLQKK